MSRNFSNEAQKSKRDLPLFKANGKLRSLFDESQNSKEFYLTKIEELNEAPIAFFDIKEDKADIYINTSLLRAIVKVVKNPENKEIEEIFKHVNFSLCRLKNFRKNRIGGKKIEYIDKNGTENSVDAKKYVNCALCTDCEYLKDKERTLSYFFTAIHDIYLFEEEGLAGLYLQKQMMKFSSKYREYFNNLQKDNNLIQKSVHEKSLGLRPSILKEDGSLRSLFNTPEDSRSTSPVKSKEEYLREIEDLNNGPIAIFTVNSEQKVDIYIDKTLLGMIVEFIETYKNHDIEDEINKIFTNPNFALHKSRRFKETDIDKGEVAEYFCNIQQKEDLIDFVKDDDDYIDIDILNKIKLKIKENSFNVEEYLMIAKNVEFEYLLDKEITQSAFFEVVYKGYLEKNDEAKNSFFNQKMQEFSPKYKQYLQEENPASKPKPKEYEMVYGEFLEISHI